MPIGPNHPALLDQPPAGDDPQRPSADLLLWAYGHTLFPMADPATEELGWYSPEQRGIFLLDPPGAFHVPRNVEREVRKGRFDIRSDTAFEQVMRECAVARSEKNGSWINEQLLSVYVELYRRGHAHSVEAWLDGALVGGLYGVHIGGAFFGESMFSRPGAGGSNSSKVCLVHLVNRLRSKGFSLLDTQFRNDHLDQFGCVEITAQEYEARLFEAIRLPAEW